MNRRPALLALALSFAFGLAVPHSPLLRGRGARGQSRTRGFRQHGILLRGVPAFWERLHELGWVEGKNLIIEARWAEGRVDPLPALMSQFTART